MVFTAKLYFFFEKVSHRPLLHDFHDVNLFYLPFKSESGTPQKKSTPIVCSSW